MKKSWKSEKTELLVSLYGQYATRYQDEKHTDDRGVFVQTYNLMLDALRCLPNEPHVLVRVAMNRYIAEYMLKLDNIKKRFPIGGRV